MHVLTLSQRHVADYDGGAAGGFGSDSDAEPGHHGGEAEQAAEGNAATGAWDEQAGSSAQDRQRDGGGARSTVDWLIQSAKTGGAVTRGRGWAGASHWRYSATAGDSQEAKAAKKPAKCV